MAFDPAQCRAARGLIEWSQQRLATAARLGLSTVRDFETKRRDVSANATNAIRHSLEAAGVEFMPAKNGKGVGVRLRSNK